MPDDFTCQRETLGGERVNKGTISLIADMLPLEQNTLKMLGNFFVNIFALLGSHCGLILNKIENHLGLI